mmetsp:Transcript_8970/g.12346  ORF Transcript_8970/g.12346 Transcript_8970/m.12346 type:complete len:169 (-) Transcript_8970:144-650(-)
MANYMEKEPNLTDLLNHLPVASQTKLSLTSLCKEQHISSRGQKNEIVKKLVEQLWSSNHLPYPYIKQIAENMGIHNTQDKYDTLDAINRNMNKKKETKKTGLQETKSSQTTPKIENTWTLLPSICPVYKGSREELDQLREKQLKERNLWGTPEQLLEEYRGLDPKHLD